MTETRQCIGFSEVEKILVKSYKSITGGREFDIDKYGPYIDAVKRVLVPSLEKQILFFLERFVYNEDFQQSSYQRYLNRYEESMLTAYEKYNDIGASIDAMRNSFTIDHLVDFLGHSLLTSRRLAKISNDFKAMGIEKNWLGHVNVLNYINEKDFWACSTYSSTTSIQYSSICCSPSKNNILSETNVEKNSHIIERTRGYKRPRKRAATHLCRKHYKLERLAQLSEGSFRVTESLYNLLKSNWDLRNSLYTKRRLKRNCVNLRRLSLANYRLNREKTDWKNKNLTFIIRKIRRPGIKTIENENQEEKNTEVKTFASLPCKVKQILSKLNKVDSSLRGFHCSFIQKKFQTKLSNVCSCINSWLSSIDVKTINLIYLICEIRKDYLNFKLKQTQPPKCCSSLFCARVMTCEALYRCGIKNSTSREKVKSQNFLAIKRANNLSPNINSANDQIISSIDISFLKCHESAKDSQNVVKRLACERARSSSSIDDVLKKLELSPFHLQETEQSFMIRSKIKDIVRSIMLCTRENLSPGQEGGEQESISIQAIISTSSLNGIKNEVEVYPVKSKSSKAMSVSKIVSLIESQIYPSKCDEECEKLTGSRKSMKSAMPKSCWKTKEQSLKSGGSVRHNKSLKKSRASLSSGESAKPKNENKHKICTTSEKLIRSKEFIESIGRPSTKKIVESIASEIFNVLAKTKSNVGGVIQDKNDYDFDVTLEIDESFQSSDNFTESISRHTHILPSMKSVKLGTNLKRFQCDGKKSSSSSSSTSSKSDVITFDNYTTMNKSMISSSNRKTISEKSYDRVKHLMREKVCKKLSESESCQENSSKTIVSSGKYYSSIPSSKTSRIFVKREISESSSTSRDCLQFSNCKDRRQCSTSDDESLSSRSEENSYLDDSSQSSAVATIDENSIYGCIEDRLANVYFKDIIHNYSDETENSPRRRKMPKTWIPYERYCGSDNCGISSDERNNCVSKYHDSEVSSEENETYFSQGFATDDETNVNKDRNYCRPCYPGQKFYENYFVGKAIAQRTPRLDNCEKFEKINGNRRAPGWSTCAIRSSSPKYCRNIYRKTRSSTNSRQKSFSFLPLNLIEKYKKRFQNIDKNLRVKVTRYIGICKNLKNNIQKQICFNDTCETSKTSLPSNDFQRRKYSGAYFGG